MKVVRTKPALNIYAVTLVDTRSIFQHAPMCVGHGSSHGEGGGATMVNE